MAVKVTFVFVSIAIIFFFFAILAYDSWPSVINDKLSFSYAQEEIPPPAPLVPQTPSPQTPSPQTPSPQDPPFQPEFSNVTNESASVPIEGEWLTYQNLSDGFQIDYPAQWENVRQGNSLIFLAPLDPSSPPSSFRTGVGIIVEDIPPEMTLDAYINKSSSTLQSGIPSESAFTVLEVTPLPGFKQGVDAEKEVFEWNDSRVGGLLRTMEIYMISGAKGYTISYAAPTSLFDTYLPIAERMIDSFQNTLLQTGLPTTTSNDSSQLPLTGDFQTSEKPIDTGLSLRIQYPANYELQPADYFAFTAPLEIGETFSSEQGRILQIEKFALSQSSSDLCSVYTNSCYASASDYLQQTFDNFAGNFSNYTLIEGPTDITIAGNPAKKSIFRCSGCYALLGLVPTPSTPSGDLRLLEITTVDQNSGNVILIEISTNEGKYPQFPPPHIQKMIDSIQFVSSQSTAETNFTFSDIVPGGQGMTGNAGEPNFPTNDTSAPTPEEFQFTTYESFAFGSVQYPSSWETLDLGNGSVVFHSPLSANESVYSEEVGFLNLNVLPNQNEEIDKFFTEQLNTFKTTFPDYTMYEGPTPLTIGGNPAIQAKFDSFYGGNSLKTIETWTTNQDKSRAYQIEYTARADLYPTFPPVHFQRIFDSIQFASPLVE